MYFRPRQTASNSIGDPSIGCGNWRQRAKFAPGEVGGNAGPYCPLHEWVRHSREERRRQRSGAAGCSLRPRVGWGWRVAPAKITFLRWVGGWAGGRERPTAKISGRRVKRLANTTRCAVPADGLPIRGLGVGGRERERKNPQYFYLWKIEGGFFVPSLPSPGFCFLSQHALMTSRSAPSLCVSDVTKCSVGDNGILNSGRGRVGSACSCCWFGAEPGEGKGGHSCCFRAETGERRESCRGIPFGLLGGGTTLGWALFSSPPPYLSVSN